MSNTITATTNDSSSSNAEIDEIANECCSAYQACSRTPMRRLASELVVECHFENGLMHTSKATARDRARQTRGIWDESNGGEAG